MYFLIDNEWDLPISKASYQDVKYFQCDVYMLWIVSSWYSKAYIPVVIPNTWQYWTTTKDSLTINETISSELNHII